MLHRVELKKKTVTGLERYLMAYGGAIWLALREHLKGIPQVGNIFYNSLFDTVRVSALQRERPHLIQKIYI